MTSPGVSGDLRLFKCPGHIIKIVGGDDDIGGEDLNVLVQLLPADWRSEFVEPVVEDLYHLPRPVHIEVTVDWVVQLMRDDEVEIEEWRKIVEMCCWYFRC